MVEAIVPSFLPLRGDFADPAQDTPARRPVKLLQLARALGLLRSLAVP
jgi:hypothetical protein